MDNGQPGLKRLAPGAVMRHLALVGQLRAEEAADNAEAAHALQEESGAAYERELRRHQLLQEQLAAWQSLRVLVAKEAQDQALWAGAAVAEQARAEEETNSALSRRIRRRRAT